MEGQAADEKKSSLYSRYALDMVWSMPRPHPSSQQPGAGAKEVKVLGNASEHLAAGGTGTLVPNPQTPPHSERVGGSTGTLVRQLSLQSSERHGENGAGPQRHQDCWLGLGRMFAFPP